VSADLISRVIDAVLEEGSDWQNRALEPVYPIIFLDALRAKIRDTESRQVKNKAACVTLGNVGAKCSLSVMNNPRNRVWRTF
jgi:putative transposase